MPVQVQVSAPDLADLAVALKYEQNGAVMRRELLKGLRAAVRPAVDEAKASIMNMPGGGLRQRSDGTWHLGMKELSAAGLRKAVARQVTTQVSLTTRSAKVKVRVRKRDMPRGFTNAPKVLQSAEGWRHPIFKTGRWAAQIGKPGWFDVPLRSHRTQYLAAIEVVMRRTADRIAGRA